MMKNSYFRGIIKVILPYVSIAVTAVFIDQVQDYYLSYDLMTPSILFAGVMIVNGVLMAIYVAESMKDTLFLPMIHFIILLGIKCLYDMRILQSPIVLQVFPNLQGILYLWIGIMLMLIARVVYALLKNKANK